MRYNLQIRKTNRFYDMRSTVFLYVCVVNKDGIKLRAPCFMRSRFLDIFILNPSAYWFTESFFRERKSTFFLIFDTFFLLVTCSRDPHTALMKCQVEPLNLVFPAFMSPLSIPFTPGSVKLITCIGGQDN